MSDVKLTQDGHVLTITIDRPSKKNAFTLEVIDGIVDALRKAQRDPECRAVILTGSGDAFCAGVDLSEVADMQEAGADGAYHWKAFLMERIHTIALTLDAFDKPVIAAVNGPAYGAGMDLALMCDMRFLSHSARLCEAYVNLGVVPGDGGCYYLPRLVGPAKALELLMSGRVVEPDEARSLGLANDVVADDKLMEHSMAFARVLTAKSPIALRMIKRATYQSMNCDLRTSLDLISSHMSVVQTLADTAEANAAFTGRRRAQFKEE